MDNDALLRLEKLRQIQRSIDYSNLGLDSGGKLSAEDADAFLTYVVSEGDPFMRTIQVIPMFSENRNIDVFNVPGRQLRKKEPGVAPLDNAVVAFSRNKLLAIKTTLQIDIEEEVYEENIEKEGFDNTLLMQLAVAYSNDTFDLAWNGDEADVGADQAFLSINDGWLALGKANGGVYDAVGQTSHLKIWKAMLIQMPRWFKANKTAINFYVSPNTELRYRAELEGRSTSLGDQYLDKDMNARYQGVKVVPLGVLPDDHAMLCNPQNLVIGIEYGMRVERDKVIKRGVHEVVMTTKNDFQFAINEGIILAENIPVI